MDLKLSSKAEAVLEARYLIKDTEGNITETPLEMFRRVAHAIAIVDPDVIVGSADGDKLEDSFFEMMIAFDFLPNSPTLMNAGTELGQLSACFVIPIGDSMEEIYSAISSAAMVHKSGGGTGFSFSRLRPEGSRVNTTGGVSTGPVSFMRVFSASSDVITQGGKRHGANMAVMSVDHPDIIEFIMCKADGVSFTNFNISVAVDDHFMNAVKDGHGISLSNPHDGKVVSEISARNVFEKIVEMAWANGDPGLVFIDEINRHNPTPQLGQIESTNPCGEQPLLPNESCNLGSINLSNMITQTDKVSIVDYVKLGNTVKLAVRFLDNVVEANKHPVAAIEEATKKTRKIGLGIMGWADMLIKLGIPYGSSKSYELAGEVASFIQEAANAASVVLAENRGTYPAWEQKFSEIVGHRNATRTTIAPTGSLSILANCSGGIEPLFALVSKRNALGGSEEFEVNPLLVRAMKEFWRGVDPADLSLPSAETLTREQLPRAIRELFVTAHDLDVSAHIGMQAVWQQYTDNAVSKTINMPSSATTEDVAEAYMLAWSKKCKGITTYRDGSREGQIFSTPNTPTEIKRGPRPRPDVTTGFTEKVKCGCGNLYVGVNKDDEGRLCETFSNLGKGGGCAAAHLEATCKLISLALRSDVPVESIIDNLEGIGCPNVARHKQRLVLSCPDGIAGVLAGTFSGSETPKVSDFRQVFNVVGQCPECGSLLSHQEGCVSCPTCGYNRC